MQPPYKGIVFQADGIGFMAFNPETGDMWSYHSITDAPQHYRITELGKKVVTVK